MSETNPTGETQKKVFTLAETRRVIPISVHWPGLYPDFEPWGFKFRLALTDKMQQKREEWLALPPAEANATEAYRNEILDETCDLLSEIPSGFGDILRPGEVTGDPGTVFRNYVNVITDPEQLETVMKIVQAANNGYWQTVLPRPFRPEVQNRGSQVPVPTT